jgi:hypothetical protein
MGKGFWKDTSGNDSVSICSGSPRSEDCGVRNARDPVALVAVLPLPCRVALPTVPDLVPLGDGEPRLFARGPAARMLPLAAVPRVDDGDADIHLITRLTALFLHEKAT